MLINEEKIEKINALINRRDSIVMSIKRINNAKVITVEDKGGATTQIDTEWSLFKDLQKNMESLFCQRLTETENELIELGINPDRKI
ncbi:MAG: hypothetical protein AB9883_07620 [Acidaminococcaceae bacterium]